MQTESNKPASLDFRYGGRSLHDLAGFGRFLVDRGYVTQNEIEAALLLQTERNPRIGTLARERRLLKSPDICHIIDYARENGVRFGQAAIDLGHLNQREVDELLSAQSESHVYVGELLIELNLISRPQLELCLREYLSIKNEPEATN